MRLLPPFALLCASLAWAAIGPLQSSNAQEKPAPSAFLAPTPPKPHPDVMALLNKGNDLASQSRWSDAMQTYEEALAKALSLKDRPGETGTLLRVGYIYYVTGEPQKALEYDERALAVTKETGDTGSEALARKQIGNVLWSTGQMSKALEQFHLSQPLYHTIGDKDGEARVLNNIANVVADLGEPQKALEYYHQALLLYRTVGDEDGESIALYNIGTIYVGSNQEQEGLVKLQQALSAFRAVGNKQGEAKAFFSIGRIYADAGQSQKALDYYDQAMRISKILGDQNSEADALSNIGIVYLTIGLPTKAMEYYNQSLIIYTATGNKADEANDLNNIGNVYRNMGQPLSALEYYLRAQPIEHAVGNKAFEANTLSNIGNIYRDIGQAGKALDYYQQALMLGRAAKDSGGEATTLLNIGVLHYNAGQTEKALVHFQKALAMQKALNNKEGQIDAFDRLGTVYADTGHVQLGMDTYQQAIGLREKYREEIGSDTAGKQAYLQSGLGLYQKMLALLLKQKQPAQAFALAQKMKARALLDEIRSSRLDLDRDLTEGEHAHLTALRNDLSRLNKEQIAEGLHSPDRQTERFKQLGQALGKAQDALASFRAELYRNRPQLSRQQAAVTLDLPGTAKLLTPDTALLEYVSQKVTVGKVTKLDRTLLFVVTLHNGQPNLDVFPLAVSSKALAEKADDLRAACADKSLRSWEGKAAELYGLLLGPAQARLAGRKRILICPDGPLWQVPFAALRDKSGKTLWERYEVTYAYSATGAWAAQEQLRDPARLHATKSLLAIADPDFGDDSRFSSGLSRAIDRPSRDLQSGDRGGLSPLPGTKAESDALQKQFADGNFLTGKAAQEADVKRLAGAYRYLHFATHGLFNGDAPMLSSVALAQPPPGSDEDGFLTAREIYDLRLHADLTVLSACNTGRGEEKSGEGIVGLTWALLAAGCPSCVVSQWSVDDATTATLMGDFYAALKAGKGKAAALRAAALRLRNDGAHSHPYFWAPFLLIGEGK